MGPVMPTLETVQTALMHVLDVVVSLAPSCQQYHSGCRRGGPPSFCYRSEHSPFGRHSTLLPHPAPLSVPAGVSTVQTCPFFKDQP